MAKRATAEELAYVRQWVPRKGYRFCAQQLKRKEGTIWRWAKAMGIKTGDIDGWLPVSEVAKICQMHRDGIIRKAQRAGALRRLKNGRRTVRVLIKETWALKLVDEQERAKAHDQARQVGYLTTSEAAKLLGVATSTLWDGLKGRGHLKFLAKTQRVQGSRGVFYLNPHDIEEARKRLAKERKLAKSLVSVKSIAIESGRHISYVAKLARKLGAKRLYCGGQVAYYIDAKGAKLLKARLMLPAPPKGWEALPSLARELGITPSGIHGWFRNRRQIIPMQRCIGGESALPQIYVPQEWAERYRAYIAQKRGGKQLKKAA